MDFAQKFVLYLDTNLFLDITRNRDNEATRNLFYEIKCDKYEAITSTFTLLEIVQEEQERWYAERELVHNKRSFDEIRTRMHERHLNKSALEEVYDSVWKVLEPYFDSEKIRMRYLDEKGWDWAFDFQKKINISASDAIHVALAYTYCDIFVTSDNQLIKNCSEYFKPHEKFVFATPFDLKSKEKLLENKVKLRFASPSKSK